MRSPMFATTIELIVVVPLKNTIVAFIYQLSRNRKVLEKTQWRPDDDKENFSRVGAQKEGQSIETEPIFEKLPQNARLFWHPA